MPNKIIATYKREFKSSNCGLSHDPVESMVRSQWQSRSKSHFYLAYRWFVAIFTTIVVINSFATHLAHHSLGLFFIYLTHWGIIINMIVGIYGAVLVSLWHFHPEYAENVIRNDEMPVAFKIYWSLHNTAMVTAFVITIIYWTVLHNATMPLSATNILSHALNAGIMFLDLLIVAYPLRLYHVIQPIIFGLSFGFFSFIYYLCDGKNIMGHPYIYNVLDWSKPNKALVTTVGTLVLALVVHMFLFSVYKLRVFIQRRFCSTDLILPTTASKMQSTNSLQSRISMVFAGETNEAFRNSSDKVNS